jgi:large subunit ribosomal protein L19
VKIKEKDNKGREKVRLQAFEGLVISTKHGNEPGATFTVRKISYGVGIERIFPLFSPMIDKIEVLKRGNVRRSKLYFIREKVSKQIKRLTRRAEMLGISTTSDIEETERKIKEAEEAAKKAEEEAAAKAAAEAEKTAAEAEQAEETSKTETEVAENTEEKKD